MKLRILNLNQNDEKKNRPMIVRWLVHLLTLVFPRPTYNSRKIHCLNFVCLLFSLSVLVLNCHLHAIHYWKESFNISQYVDLNSRTAMNMVTCNAGLGLMRVLPLVFAILIDNMTANTLKCINIIYWLHFTELVLVVEIQ